MADADARARATRLFEARFGGPPALLVRAPARANLIGEHTDYNDGFVLPAALDLHLWLALCPRNDGVVAAVSDSADAPLEFALRDMSPAAGWGRYVQGMAAVLTEQGAGLRGWDGAIASDIPVGAGLSSSAALELAVARAFAAAADLPWDPTAMALAGHRVEREWIGVNSGVMDQMICALGRAGTALLLDCGSLATEHVPVPANAAIVVMDTTTRRQLEHSGYNARREECEAAAAAMGVASLRAVTATQLDAATLDPVLRRRAHHVVTENERTLATAAALRAGDLATAGDLLDDSHRSLRDDFEVSGPALDAIVAAAGATEGCYGARMTGAGFAGCAVALVARDASESFVAQVSALFEAATGLRPDLHVCTTVDGVSVEAV